MVEVKNGLLGLKKLVLMRLIELMTFRNDSLIRNLIGIGGESVCLKNNFHFALVRTFFERHIIPSKKERRKEITIKSRNIIFNLGDGVSRSILINILIKNTILQCTFNIKKGYYSGFSVGICTPKQVNDVMVKCLGSDKDCGGSFWFSSYSRVRCSGNYSLHLKEGGISNEEEEITAFVNNKNANNKGQKGKMNIIRNQKIVPHTIVNIPTKDGVHFGFSCYNYSSQSTINTLSIISLIHVSVLPPPFNDGMRCIAYDFQDGFKHNSYYHKDEEGKEVPNIREYYE